MTEMIWSCLMKLNRLNVEQYMTFYSKFEFKIQRYVDFIADFAHVHYALRLTHGTRQFGLHFCLSSAVMACTSCSL